MARTAKTAKAARGRVGRGFGRGFRRLVVLGMGAALTFATTVAQAQSQPQRMSQVAPQSDAFSSRRPDAPPPWDRLVGVVLSLGSTMINVVYFPVKLAVGVAGAEAGGVAGAMTGGDVEAAAGIWNVTTDGSYFASPATLDNRQDFNFGGDAR